MHRGALYTLLFSLGLTVLAPSIAHAASEGGQPADIGTSLNERLSNEAAEQAQKEQAVLAKGKRLSVLAEGKAIRDDIFTLQSTIRDWENQMETLLTNAEGQALATNPVNVQYFVNLQNAERYPQSQVDVLDDELQSMLTQIEDASDDSLYTPSDTLVTAMRTAGKQVKEALAQYQGLQNKLRAILQTSKGVQVTADSPTLKVAMEKLGEEQAKRELEAEQIAQNDRKRRQ